MVLTPIGALMVLFVCPSRSNAEEFLGLGAHHARIARQNMNLLQELEEVVGREQRYLTEDRVCRLEDAMQPLFQVLPKDSANRLDALGVRYLLRRLFVERHGWFVNGIETNGQAWNSTSPTEVFAGVRVQGMFQTKLNNHGFDLHHAAVLAATLESFVHEENIIRLRVAFNLLRMSPENTSLTVADIDRALVVYMMIYVDDRLQNFTQITRRGLGLCSLTIMDDIPSWSDTLLFADQVRKAVLDVDEVAAKAPTSWNTTLKVIEQIGERYGQWQNRECRHLKAALVEIGDRNTGRVRLENFYEEGLSSSKWMFRESVDYLRELGALDESDPNQLSVIISNYVHGHSNCLASSKYFEVCCIDECIAIMAHIEKHIAKPVAKPESIIALVSNTPSDTVSAPRTLPRSLVQHLWGISKQHNGVVPLHGRLFAQWLHHAYPQECSYPHIAGSFNHSSPQEFMRITSKSAAIDDSEMQAVIEDSRQKQRTMLINATESLPWSSEEELFVRRAGMADPNVSSSWNWLMWLAVVSLLWALAQKFLSSSVVASMRKNTLSDKYTV